MPRKLLSCLVYALPVLVVLLVVFLGAAVVLHQTGDDGGARLVGRIALLSLLLLIADALLLLGALGLAAVSEREDRTS